ncbi:HYR domain-containing protein [uncultured Draconibacterium sp.]|uniref:HYR domain-containing protein n=1 Tax=uncultured Draconibacterium sp. TaxID=1573823 RepID=UPI00326084FC
MTKTKHNQTLEIALFIAAVFTVLMGVASVKGSTLSTSQHTNYSKIYGETVISDDTTGFVCPEDISTYTDLNSCDALISSGLNIEDPYNNIQSLNWRMEGATNAQSASSGINQINSFVFNQGVTFITYFISDVQGRSFNCTFEVVVTDNQAPRFIFSPGEIIISNAPNDCSASVNWSKPVLKDNCVSEDQLIVESNYSPGDIFPVGTTEVIYRVSDGTNEVEHSFKVVVNDTEQPRLSAPQPRAIVCGEEVEDAFTTWEQFEKAGGSASDNCEVDFSSFRYVSQTASSIRCPYIITRTYSIQDKSGNVATVNRLIEVTGEEPEIEETEPDVSEPVLKSGTGATAVTVTLYNRTDVSCYGGTDGAIDLDTSSTNGPITNIVWDDGPTTLDRSGLSAGTYTIRVTDGDGTEVQNYTIDEPNPLIPPTASADQTICYNSFPLNLSATLASGGTAPYSYQWQSSPNGSTWNNISSATSTTLTSVQMGSLTTETYYRIRVDDGNCPVEYSNVVTISIDPLSDGGTANSDQTICENSTPNAISLIGYVGTIQWQSSPNGSSSWSDISGATGSTLTSGQMGSLTSDRYYRAEVTSGVCSPDYSNVVAVSVDPASNGGSANSNQTICENSSPNAISLTGYVGTIQWQSSPNGSSSWSDISGATGSTLTSVQMGNLTSDRYYRAEVTSGVCSPDYSNVVAISVDPTSDGGVAGPDQTICENSTPNAISLSGYVGTIQWQSSPNGSSSWSDISGATGTTLTSGQMGSLTSDRYYRAEVTSGVCSPDYSNVVAISVDPTSDGGVAGPDQTICENSTPNAISLSGYVGTIQWQSSPNGSSSWSDISGATGSTLTSVQMGNLTSDRYYRAEVTSGVCSPDYSNVVAISVDPTSDGGVAGPDQTICENSTPNAISLSGYVGTIQWQSSPNGSSSWSDISGATGTTLTSGQMGSLTSDRYYRAEVTSGVCSPDYSNVVHISVNIIPTVDDPGNFVVCSGQLVSSIVFSGSGTSYSWTNDNTSIGIAASGTDFIPLFTAINSGAVNQVANITVTPIYSSGGVDCPGTPISFTLTVTAPIIASSSISPSDSILCNGGTAIVTLSASGGTAPYSFTFNGVTKTNGTFTGIIAGNYNWSVTDANSCGPETGSVIVTEPNPLAILSADVTTPVTCNGGTATITIVATGGSGTYNYTFNGQTNSTGVFTGVYAGTGLSIQVTDDNGCGPVFTAIDVDDIPALDATLTTVPMLCNGGSPSGEIEVSNPTGGSGTYEVSIDGTNWFPVSGGSPYTFTALTTGNYYVEIRDQVTPACIQTLPAVTITEPTVFNTAISADAILCYGGTTDVTISATGGTPPYTYNFEGATSNTTGIFVGITGSVAGTDYDWSVTDANGCEDGGTITITQPAEITNLVVTVDDDEICEGEDINLHASASGGTSPLKYNWTGPDGFVRNNTQNPMRTSAVTAAEGWYVATVLDANNCSKKDSVYVTVHPSPDVIVTNNNPDFCSGGTANISLSSAVPGTTFSWTVESTDVSGASDDNGTNISQTLTATGNVPGTVVYTIVPTANGCVGEPVEVVVTVNPIPIVTLTPETSVFCNESLVRIALSSNVAGTTFSWVREVTSGSISGGSSSGTSTVQISQDIDAGGGGAQVQYIVTPTANGCTGEPDTAYVEFTWFDIDQNFNLNGPANNSVVCPGEEMSWRLRSWNGWNYRVSFSYEIDNPNVGLTPSSNERFGYEWDRNARVQEWVTFNAVNNTDVPQVATIIFTVKAYRRSNDAFLCEVISRRRTFTVDPFTMVCPADYVQDVDGGTCGAYIDTDDPIFTCPPATEVTWDMTGATTASSPGSGVNYVEDYTFNVGTTTIDYSAEDAVGNITSCTFDVTVTDEQDPTINCPVTDTTIYAVAGQCGVNYDFSHIVADDNCTVDQFTQTEGPASNTLFPVGTTALGFYAEDESGNSTECSFNVIVVDTISPSINCIGDQTVCAEPGMDYTNIGTGWNATVSDNCSGTTVAYTVDGSSVGNTLNTISFSVAGSPHSVVATATDAAGNTAICSFEVTVDEKPAITIQPVGGDLCLSGEFFLTVEASGTETLSYQWRRNGSLLSNDAIYQGTNNDTLWLTGLTAGQAGNYDVVVTNACGSATSSPATLSVSTAPVITLQPASQTDCRGNLVEFDVAAAQGNPPYSYYWEMRETSASSWVEAALVNNIDFNADSSQLKVYNIGNPDNPNQAQYRVTVTDACGNDITSSIATLTSNEVEDVTISVDKVCEGGGTTITGHTSGATPVEYQWLFDDGSGSGWDTITNGGPYSGASSQTLTINNATESEAGEYRFRAIFPINVPNNTSYADCRDLASTADAVTFIVDNGPDIVATPWSTTICPGSSFSIDLTNTEDPGNAITTYRWTRSNVPQLSGIGASGSGENISATLTSSDPSNMYTMAFYITAEADGCESKDTVYVSVGDTTFPLLSTVCPSDISVNNDADECGAVINYTTPLFNDNCDGNDLGGTLESGLASGSTFPIGTTTVTYEYTDAAGNGPLSCSFDVTVTDNQPPTALCQDTTIQLDATGNATITPADIDNGSSDNCGVPTLSLDITTFDCTNLGANTVTLTATDSVGNTATCTATVTIDDTDNPVDITATVSQQDTLCSDDPTVVDISITGGVGTIEYTFDGTTNGTGQFTVPAGYDYAWSVSNSLGCGTTSGTFHVEISPNPVTPVFTVGATTLCQDAPNEVYTATATNSTSISYSVLPAAAGTINATTGEMDWDVAFSGQATITATAAGFCSIATEDLTVDITPTVGTPTAITVSVGTEPSCQLTNGTTTTTYSTTATNSTGFNWSISNPLAGSIDPATGTMTWADGFSGTVDIQVTANGCNGPSAQVVRTVNITPTVGTPSIPTPSDSVICQGSATTTYSTFASDATVYNWTVTGAGNSISGTGTTAMVTWDPNFSGTATISVTANGCNGPSASVQTTVDVLPTPTATISGDNSVCQNTASPDITFTNPQNLPVTVTYNINGGVSQTIDIAANSIATVAVPTATVGDFDYNLVRVEYQSTPGCINSVSGTATVTIRPEAPAAPAAITGNDYVLPVTTETYTIAAVSNATSYNWTVPSGWTIISGQGTTSITVTTGIAGEGGEIKVIAQNDCGDSPETALTVDINPDLSIITQPVNQTDCYANSVLFSVTISGGAPPISYVWQRKRPTDADFSDITGDPDISYPVDGQILVSNIGSASNPDGTQYRVRITDNGGSDETSNPATLTVNQVLTMTPVDVLTTICEGEDLSFSATTGGETPISMRWEKDGLPVTDDIVISGSGTTTISLTGVRPADSGEYRLAVTFPMTQPNNDPGNPDTCVVVSTLYRTLVVNPLPVLAGPVEVCVGQTINWTPNTGGTWTSSDPSIATIADDGLVTGIAEGTVTFTFTETATGCSATTPPVTVHPLPTGEIAGNSDICAGDSATLIMTLTGTSPWNIIYTDGATADTVLGITASPYTLTVAPATTSTYALSEVSDVYCDATSLNGNAIVTVYPLPTAVLSGDTTVCVGSTAGLLVELTGVQPWSIIYTDGVTLDTVSGITSSPYLLSVTPGSNTTYSLTAVSDTNCSGTSLTGTATVQVDQLPIASAGGSDTICVTGTATVSGANATDGTILWTHDGAGSLTDETTLTPTYIAAISDAGDTVILTLTVTSNNTCFVATPATATYTIVVDPLPVATAGGSETICTNGTATVSGASAANGNVLWTHNGVGVLSDETTLTPSYTAGSGDTESTVKLTLTVTSDNQCAPQTDTATFLVNVLPEPQVNQPDSQEVCTGTSTAMITFSTTNSTGTTTYSWTNTEPSIGLAASGTGNIIAPFSAINNGTEPIEAVIEVIPHLTVGGEICDGPPKIFTITVNPEPVAVAPYGLTYCNGITSDSIPISGSPTGVVFDISGGAAIGLADINGVTVIPPFTALEGSATLTVVPRFGGCTGLPVSFNVTVRPTPVVTISGSDTVCQNSAPPSINVTNPMVLPVVVTYTINGTNSYSLNIPGRSNASISVPTNIAGTFDYNLESVKYLDSNPPTCQNDGISGSATMEIIALPEPTISGPTNICAETSDHIYVTEGGMNNYSWAISAGGTITAGGSPTDTSITVTWNSGGSHNVSVRYDNAAGCSAAASTVYPVNVYALPEPTITGSTSACLNTSRTYSTQPGMTDYQWTISAGATLLSGGGPNDNSITVSWDSVGTQMVAVNYVSSNGCTANAQTTKHITVNPLPEPTISGPDTVCAGTSGHVYTTESGMSTYIWNISSGGTVTSGGTANSNTATIQWNTDGLQNVSISYIDPATGCEPEYPEIFEVWVDEMPTPTITGLADVCVGESAIVYRTEPGMDVYDWTVSTGGTITAGGDGTDSLVVTWNASGSQTISINYENISGCSAVNPSSFPVNVHALPTPILVGDSETCIEAQKTYTTVSGMTDYVWTIPPEATIISGGTSTDDRVTVIWNTTGNYTIALDYTSAHGCNASSPTEIPVTVHDLPSPSITGPSEACSGGAVNVYTTESGMTGYTWSVTGGTITGGGNGTDSLVVVWNTSGTQTVSVNYHNINNCSALSPTDSVVNVVDPAPPTCPTDMNVCDGDAAFILSGESPVGGDYSGTGVYYSAGSYWFDPGTAGPGSYTIAYTMPNICADQCVFNITVTETPVGSATDRTICNGEPANISLSSTVAGTTFTWTSNVISGSASGASNGSGDIITDTLINNDVYYPGSGGTNARVRYTVTASNNGCSSTFTVDVTVRPQIAIFDLTWNSNFVEDFIEVCVGAEALSDNDIEILHPVTGNLVGSSTIPSSWNPTFLYGPSPNGPWTGAPGSWRGGSYYEWLVDLSVNNQLGYHYFSLRITDPSTGCVQYSNPAILNVVSSMIVEAGDPEYLCGGSTVNLSGAYVGGLSSSTVEGRWSETSFNPSSGSSGTWSGNSWRSDPENVSYTPPAGYIGEITLTLTTNDPSGVCEAIEDTRTITVVPPNSFNGCWELAGWPLSGTNSNGTRDDSEEPCLVTIVGSNNLSDSPGTTDITHCTGSGIISFDWTFLAPANKVVWHQEDQKEGGNSSSSNMRVARPSNVSVGDLIIVTIHADNDNLTFSPPSGFVLIENTRNSNRNVTLASFYKIATAAEPVNYNFGVNGGTVDGDDMIYASRVTGHDPTSGNTIGSSSESIVRFNRTNGEEGYRQITMPGLTAGSNSMLVSALAVWIDNDYDNDNNVEYVNAPIGMTTMYYRENETATRVATQIVSGSTGSRSFQWPSYNSRNRNTMDAAAHMFTINPETIEEDAAYYLVNGVPTLLGNSNGSSGSGTVSVSSGDSFGFRVGTSTNSGGPGRLIIYNLNMPNDAPVLSGLDSVVLPGCHDDAYVPVFDVPVSVDDCGTAIAIFDSIGTVTINDCERRQTRTWIYEDDCGEQSEPFTQTAIWYVAEPITITCPSDPMLEACTDEDTITSRYNDWIAGFSASGGCELTTNIFEIPPLVLSNIACGDTLSFTYRVTDGCGQDTSCTSTFTVQPIDTLIVYCPGDTVLANCFDPDSIAVAYTVWKAGFGYDGGCAAVTDNMDEFPALTDLSCGGDIEFIYTVYNSCGQFESCLSTFSVEPPQEISINVPAGVSLPLCSKISDIEAAYTTWRDSFYYTGGCNVITNIDSFPELGDLSCGGTLEMTYRVRNENSSCEDLKEGYSFFSVAEAPNLILSCPADTTIPGCLGIQAITDAYDTWVDGFRASGGCDITTNIDSIPPLGGLVCNGSISFTFIVGNDSTLCSAKDSCTSTFTIGAAPMLSVVTPADTVVNGCNTDSVVITLFNDWKSRFDFTGGCVGYVQTSDISVYELPSSCGGTVTVHYSAWDNCSQLVTDSATFTLNPEVISISAPFDEVQPACQTQAEIDSAFADWKSRFSFSGGCGTVGTDLAAIDAPSACGGTIVVNFSAQDVCGQVVNTSAIFTIDLPSSVMQEPTFDVPADITIYRNDTCGYDADTVITGTPANLTDNCTASGNLSMSHNDSIVAGSCASEIIIYRKWTVTDNCLNETSQYQLITVTDTTPPVVVCAADVVDVADLDDCQATGVNIGTTTATDNCLLASLVGTRSDGLLITDPFPVGLTTIIWTATDACGNTDTCMQNVTIVDDQLPTIACPAGVDQDADPDECFRQNVVISDPTADDNCMLESVTWRMTGATTGTSAPTGLNYVGGQTFNVGVTTVTYYATDAFGNTDSCAFSVTIHDITPPAIDANCTDATDSADPDMCSKVPATLVDPDYHDDCWPKDSLSVRWEMTGATTGTGNGFVTDSTFNVGVTEVTYYISDPDGNETNCTFYVTILDVTPPVITAGCTDVSETALPDECSKIPTTLIDPDYSDTCWPKDSLTLSYTISGATTGSGSGIVSGVSFNVGVSTVTYTVTDPDGNSAECSFTVTIVDVTAPVIEIGDCIPVSDYADADSCSKIPATIVDPDYSDTCWPKDSLELSYTITGATTGSGIGSVIGISFNVGVSTVTYTVTDPDGNSDNCSFTVTIIDITPPNINITGCEDVTDTTDANNCTVIPGIIEEPDYADDCWPKDSLLLEYVVTGATTASGTGSVTGVSFAVGISYVTYTVTDPDGNSDDCNFEVTILPFDMPAFTSGCPPDVSADNDPGICGADLVIPTPTVNDPCNLGYTITNNITGTDNASGYYPVDTTYVVWTITPALGDPDSCIQMVIVRDVESPVITTCPVDQNIEGCDTTVATLSPAFSSTLTETDYATFSDATNQGVANDNCAIVRVTYIDVANGTCPLVITRTWTVYDAAGNSDSCDQTITINETEPPVADCPPNLESPSDFDSIFAMFTIPDFSISDNCTDSADIDISWTITGTTIGSGTGLIPSPYRFYQGLSTVTYTFVDACGNSSTCVFTVYVHYPPDIECLLPDTSCTDLGLCYNHIEAGDMDNPGIPINVNGDTLDWVWTVYNPDNTIAATGSSRGISPQPVGPVDFQIGTSRIHWYAENPSGHDECEHLHTVEDCEAPLVTPSPFEDCVDLLSTAIYHGDVDNLELNPDYPVGDYKTMLAGDSILNIDLSTYTDNCCILSDGYSLRWEIDFEGNNPAEPSIQGTGQPSEYAHPVTGVLQDIKLWGDGVTFLSRVHTITYWITDCNGNESAPIETTITINPRPELIKVTN